jgi:hypothetical protein
MKCKKCKGTCTEPIERGEAATPCPKWCLRYGCIALSARKEAVAADAGACWCRRCRGTGVEPKRKGKAS